MADIQQDLVTVLRKLNDNDTCRDVRLARTYIYEILSFATNGCDIIPALPTIVKLLAHSDTFVKRVAGELMAVHAEQNPEMVLLATNTLVQDCKDISPIVRSHGLRVLGSLQSSSAAEMLSKAISDRLEDNSPSVRRSAALATSALYQVSPTSITDGGIWDLLYRHLSDPDPPTVASCLCALEDIFAKESGVVVSNKLGQYLVSNLPSFTPVVQRFVLQFLLKHSPKSKSQVFDHLNDLDESLTNSNSLATTLCALELFCHFGGDLPKVKNKAYVTAWAALKKNLARERNEEVVAAIIDYLNAVDFPVSVCVQDYNKFFCRDDDSVFLVRQKVKMLSRLITPDSAESIFEELVRGARYLDPRALTDMVQNVTDEISVKQELEKPCVDFLRRLLQLDNKTVLDCVVKVLPSVTLSDESLWKLLAPSLHNCHQHVESTQGKIALLEMIRSHSTLLDNGPEIVENIMSELENEEEDGEELQRHKQQKCGYENKDQKLKLSLLGAMVTLCLQNPAKLQLPLARLMELCIQDADRNVRDRALFLYGYLVGKAKQLSQSKDIYASTS